MKNEIRMMLHIESRLGEGDTCEVVRFETVGCLRNSGGVSSLSYAEPREEGVKRSFTTLTFRPGTARVHMHRRGGTRAEVIFEVGQTHAGIYEVEPYSFDMAVRSHEIVASLGEEGGEILLRYEREIGSDKAPVVFRLTGSPLYEEVTL
jgi:uncharacterized beta-barrel protein YwiB (DUF1934 family)